MEEIASDSDSDSDKEIMCDDPHQSNRMEARPSQVLVGKEVMHAVHFFLFYILFSFQIIKYL